MQTAGLRFLASAIDAGDLETYLDFNLTSDHFTGMDLQVFSYIDAFAKEYGKLPTVDTIREGTGHNLGTQPEPTKFYYDELKRQYTHTSIVKAYQDVRVALSDDPHKAFSILEDFVLAHSTDLRRSQIVGLDSSFDIVHDYYIKKRLAGDDFGIAMGWPYLDGMTQGLQGGDIISIIGRPASGKTFLIINAALEAYRRKKRVLVVSMEMKPELIIHRTSSIISSVPLSSIRAAELSSLQRDKLFGSLRELKDNDKSMWILDGSMSATVDDVYLWAKRLQPDIIFIDGAYIMQHKNARLDQWARMAETAAQVKTLLATKLNVPVVCSYQFSKESAKKSKGPQGLEDIYGSDVISQLSSLVLGLLQPETIETVLRREVKILKGRQGEIGTFTINWDFNRMDFSEVAPADIEEDLHYT